MVIIKLIPQARDKNMIGYEVSENIIKTTINGLTDTFDFTEMPDGELDLYDEDGVYLNETNLPENPIRSAKKINDVLTVEILFTINPSETDERLLFPKPMTVEEFNTLMKEVGTNGEDEMENARTD